MTSCGYRQSPQASTRTACNRSANRGAAHSLQINETLRLFGYGRLVNGSSVSLGDVAQLESRLLHTSRLKEWQLKRSAFLRLPGVRTDDGARQVAGRRQPDR